MLWLLGFGLLGFGVVLAVVVGCKGADDRHRDARLAALERRVAELEAGRVLVPVVRGAFSLEAIDDAE